MKNIKGVIKTKLTKKQILKLVAVIAIIILAVLGMILYESVDLAYNVVKLGYN